MILPTILHLLLLLHRAIIAAASSYGAQYHLRSSAVADDINACPDLPPRRAPPTSVRDLRIDDIRVVAALGDSITAAYGAKGVHKPPPSMGTTTEDRGASFSIGGDAGFSTLPNFVQRYQPAVRGASVSSHRAEICYGVMCPPLQYHTSDHFNAAQSGAMVPNLHAELMHLIRIMKADSQINFESDYKLLTIFIGNNDACLGCLPISAVTWLSPAAYELTIRAVMDRIRASIPRVVVNIIQGFNVSQVWDVTRQDPYCEGLRQGGTVFECACAFLPGPAGPGTRLQMDSLTQAYNTRIETIAASYNNNPSSAEFAVIADPLLRDARVRREYLSNVDCFHPTVAAHGLIARGVWGNLFRAAGEKRGVEEVEREDGVWCPTEGDRIVV